MVIYNANGDGSGAARGGVVQGAITASVFWRQGWPHPLHPLRWYPQSVYWGLWPLHQTLGPLREGGGYSGKEEGN